MSGSRWGGSDLFSREQPAGSATRRMGLPPPGSLSEPRRHGESTGAGGTHLRRSNGTQALYDRQPIEISVVLFVVVILLPLAAAVGANRRLGVGWRTFGGGGLRFFGLSLLSSLPPVAALLAGLTRPLSDAAQALQPPARAILTTTIWALQTALIPEGLRYAGFCWLMRKQEKSWERALMYGLGAGAGVVASRLVTPFLTAAQLHKSIQVVLVAAPAARSLLAVWGAGWALVVQVALTVILLQLFRGGGRRWLGVAILGHAAWLGVPNILGRLVIFAARSTGPDPRVLYTVSFLTSGLLGLLALWGILMLREEPASVEEEAAPRLPVLAR
jgi:uncharacterized membrane protein YhfC